MTNCARISLYILNSIGIDSVQINILHSYTSRQKLVDSDHRDYRREEPPLNPSFRWKLTWHIPWNDCCPSREGSQPYRWRVPVTNGALADFTVQLKEQ
jgi:glyceraldehyde 3-phosphate dehydrogenase